MGVKKRNLNIKISIISPNKFKITVCCKTTKGKKIEIACDVNKDQAGRITNISTKSSNNSQELISLQKTVRGIKIVMPNVLETAYPGAELMVTSSGDVVLNGIANKEKLQLTLDIPGDLKCQGRVSFAELNLKARHVNIQGKLLVEQLSTDVNSVVLQNGCSLTVKENINGKIGEFNNFGILNLGKHTSADLSIFTLNNYRSILGELTTTEQKKVNLNIGSYENKGRILVNNLSLKINARFNNGGFLGGERCVEIDVNKDVLEAFNNDFIWCNGDLTFNNQAQFDNHGFVGAKNLFKHKFTNTNNHAVMLAEQLQLEANAGQAQAVFANGGLFMARAKADLQGPGDFVNGSTGICYAKEELTGNLVGKFENQSSVWSKVVKLSVDDFFNYRINTDLSCKEEPLNLEHAIANVLISMIEKNVLQKKLSKDLKIVASEIAATSLYVKDSFYQTAHEYINNLANFIAQEKARIYCRRRCYTNGQSYIHSKVKISLKQLGDDLDPQFQLDGRITSEIVKAKAPYGAIHVTKDAGIYGKKLVKAKAKSMQLTGLILNKGGIVFAAKQLAASLHCNQITAKQALDRLIAIATKVYLIKGKSHSKLYKNFLSIIQDKASSVEQKFREAYDKIHLDFKQSKMQGEIKIVADRALKNGVTLTSGNISEAQYGQFGEIESDVPTNSNGDWIEENSTVIASKIEHKRTDGMFCQDQDSYWGASEEIDLDSKTCSQAGQMIIQGVFKGTIKELMEQIRGSEIKASKGLWLFADFIKHAGFMQAKAMQLIGSKKIELKTTGSLYSSNTIELIADEITQNGLLLQQGGLRFCIMQLINTCERLNSKEAHLISLFLLIKILQYIRNINYPEASQLNYQIIDSIIEQDQDLYNKLYNLVVYLDCNLPKITARDPQEIILKVNAFREQGLTVTPGDYKLSFREKDGEQQAYFNSIQIANNISIANDNIALEEDNYQGVVRSIKYQGKILSQNGLIISLGTLKAKIKEVLKQLADGCITAIEEIKAHTTDFTIDGAINSAKFMAHCDGDFQQNKQGEINADQTIDVKAKNIINNGTLQTNIIELIAKLGKLELQENSRVTFGTSIKMQASKLIQDGLLEAVGGFRFLLEHLSELQNKAELLYNLLNQAHDLKSIDLRFVTKEDFDNLQAIYSSQDLSIQDKLNGIINKLKSIIPEVIDHKQNAELLAEDFTQKGEALINGTIKITGEEKDEVLEQNKKSNLKGFIVAKDFYAKIQDGILDQMAYIGSKQQTVIDSGKFYVHGDLFSQGTCKIKSSEQFMQTNNSEIKTQQKVQIESAAIELDGLTLSKNVAMQSTSTFDIKECGIVRGIDSTNLQGVNGRNKGNIIGAQTLALEFHQSFVNAKKIAAKMVELKVKNGVFQQDVTGSIWSKTFISILAKDLRLRGFIAKQGGLRYAIMNLQKAINDEIIDEPLVTALAYKLIEDAVKTDSPEAINFAATQLKRIKQEVDQKENHVEKWQALKARILELICASESEHDAFANIILEAKEYALIDATIVTENDLLVKAKDANMGSHTVVDTHNINLITGGKLNVAETSFSQSEKKTTINSGALDLNGKHVTERHYVKTRGQTAVAEHALLANEEVLLETKKAPSLGIMNLDANISVDVQDETLREQLDISADLKSKKQLKIKSPKVDNKAKCLGAQGVEITSTSTFTPYTIRNTGIIDSHHEDVLILGHGISHAPWGQISAAEGNVIYRVSNADLQGLTYTNNDIIMPTITPQIRFNYDTLQARGWLRLNFSGLNCFHLPRVRVLGSLAINVAGNTPVAINTLQAIECEGRFYFNALSYALNIGNNIACTRWSAHDELKIKVGKFNLINGGLYGRNIAEAESVSSYNMQLGRLANSKASFIKSDRQVSLKSGAQILSNKIDFISQGGFFVKGSLFDGIETKLCIDGDARLEVPFTLRLLYENLPAGIRVNLGAGSGYKDRYKIRKSGRRVLSAPSIMQVRGTLYNSNYPINLVGSKCYFRHHQGVMASINTINAGEIWRNYGLTIERGRRKFRIFGGRKKIPVWHDLGINHFNSVSYPGIFTSDNKITVTIGNYQLTGIIYAPTVIFKNCNNITIGQTGNVLLPGQEAQRYSVELIRYLRPSGIWEYTDNNSTIIQAAIPFNSPEIPNQDIVSIGTQGMFIGNPKGLPLVLPSFLQEMLTKEAQLDLLHGCYDKINSQRESKILRRNAVAFARQGTRKLSKQVIEQEKQNLFAAIKSNDQNQIRLILTKDLNINSACNDDLLKWSPLHAAVLQNNHGLVELLIQHGANLDAEDYICCTPLHYACLTGNAQLVRYLIDAGANFNARTYVKASLLNDNLLPNGFTALHVAVLNNQLDVVKTLLEYEGLDIEAKDEQYGITPLHLAHCLGNKEIVHCFLERGVTKKQNLKVARGLQVASELHHISDINTLEQAVTEPVRLEKETMITTPDGKTKQALSTIDIYPKNLIKHIRHSNGAIICNEGYFLDINRLYITGTLHANKKLVGMHVNKTILEQLVYESTQRVIEVYTKSNIFMAKADIVTRNMDIATVQDNTGQICAGKMSWEGGSFNKYGGSLTAGKGGINARFTESESFTAVPVVGKNIYSQYSKARSKLGLNKAEITSFGTDYTIYPSALRSEGKVHIYCDGKVELESYKTVGMEDITFYSKDDINLKFHIKLNQLPTVASRNGDMLAITSSTREVGVPASMVANKNLQLIAKGRLRGQAPQFAAQFGCFQGKSVEIDVQRLKTDIQQKSRGIQGFAYVQESRVLNQENAAQPIFLVKNLTVRSTNGDAVIVSPILLSDEQKGAFILEAKGGDARLETTELKNKEERERFSVGVNMAGLSAIQKAARGGLKGAARSLAEEVPLLASLVALSKAKGGVSIIDAGTQLAACALDLYALRKAGHLNNLGDLKNYLLRNLGFDKIGNWSVDNLTYKIRFGTEEYENKWTEVVAGCIKTANVLLKSTRDVNIFAQDIQCKDFAVRARRKMHLGAREQKQGSHSGSSGLNVGLQSGVPFASMSYDSSKIRAQRFVNTIVKASNTVTLVSAEAIKLRGAFLETAKAFVATTSFLIESLQNECASKYCNLSIDTTDNLSVGMGKRNKRWKEQQFGISASETLHVNARENIHLKGGILAVKHDATPLSVIYKGEVKSLYHYHIPKDEDCAFHALGIARAIAATQLLAKTNDLAIRELVASEIASKVIEGATCDDTNYLLPKSMQPERVKVLRTELIGAENLLEKVVKDINTLHHINVYSVKKLIQFPHLMLKERQRLEAALTRLENVEAAIHAFAKEARTYEEYVTYFVASPGSWLGFEPDYNMSARKTGVIDAIAKINNLKVRIWQQQDSRPLQVVHESDNFGIRIVDLLHIRQNNFDLLHEKPGQIVTPRITYEDLFDKESGYNFNINLIAATTTIGKVVSALGNREISQAQKIAVEQSARKSIWEMIIDQFVPRACVDKIKSELVWLATKGDKLTQQKSMEPANSHTQRVQDGGVKCRVKCK